MKSHGGDSLAAAHKKTPAELADAPSELTCGAADHERGGGPQRQGQLVAQQGGLDQSDEHHLEQADQLDCKKNKIKKQTRGGRGGEAQRHEVCSQA